MLVRSAHAREARRGEANKQATYRRKWCTKWIKSKIHPKCITGQTMRPYYIYTITTFYYCYCYARCTMHGLTLTHATRTMRTSKSKSVLSTCNLVNVFVLDVPCMPLPIACVCVSSVCLRVCFSGRHVGFVAHVRIIVQAQTSNKSIFVEIEMDGE